MTTNKPEVKRYDCTSEDSYHCHGCFTMKEQLRGDYVEWEAYEALQAECEALRKAAETSAADANVAERECSKALRALEGLERVAKVVSDNSDAVCGENNQLRVECEKLREHLQNLIDQTAPLEPAPGNPMWSRRIQLDEVIAERDQLRAECEKLRKDAERYRWLREQEASDNAICVLDCGEWVKPAMVIALAYSSAEDCDAAIDAAMQRDNLC